MKSRRRRHRCTRASLVPAPDKESGRLHAPLHRPCERPERLAWWLAFSGTCWGPICCSVRRSPPQPGRRAERTPKHMDEGRGKLENQPEMICIYDSKRFDCLATGRRVRCASDRWQRASLNCVLGFAGAARSPWNQNQTRGGLFDTTGFCLPHSRGHVSIIRARLMRRTPCGCQDVRRDPDRNGLYK